MSVARPPKKPDSVAIRRSGTEYFPDLRVHGVQLQADSRVELCDDRAHVLARHRHRSSSTDHGCIAARLACGDDDARREGHRCPIERKRELVGFRPDGQNASVTSAASSAIPSCECFSRSGTTIRQHPRSEPAAASRPGARGYLSVSASGSRVTAQAGGQVPRAGGGYGTKGNQPVRIARIARMSSAPTIPNTSSAYWSLVVISSQCGPLCSRMSAAPKCVIGRASADHRGISVRQPDHCLFHRRR